MKLDELILKYIWKFQRPRIVKTLREKKAGEFALLDFETNYRATVIRQCGENTRADKYISRTAERDTCIYGELK